MTRLTHTHSLIRLLNFPRLLPNPGKDSKISGELGPSAHKMVLELGKEERSGLDSVQFGKEPVIASHKLGVKTSLGKECAF